MKFNKWTLGLAAAGVVSLASVAQAEEAAMSQVLTAVSSTTLSGYVDTSAIWKFGSGNAALPGRAFDGVGKLDGFNLNVVSVTLEKPLNEDQWAAGYNVQLLFGPDSIGYNLSVGNGAAVAFPSDFGVKQAYVALRTPVGNGIDWKIGTFTTIVGYESFESYLDPNYSRSFGWQLEPTQHTGVLASYQLTDAVSVSAGVANTWSAGINARNARGPGGSTVETIKTYMASVTITAPESWGFLAGSAWYAGIIDGFSGNPSDTTTLYVGGSVHTPIEGLSVGAAFDYRWDGVGASGVNPADNWAYAIAGYASFAATEKLKLNARLDLTKGTDGTWFNSAGPGADDQNVLGSVTLTADYALWANVISRAEFRWDRDLGGDKPYGGSPTADTDESAVTAAINVIYKF